MELEYLSVPNLQTVKFASELLISSQTSLSMWLLIYAGIQVISR